MYVSLYMPIKIRIVEVHWTLVIVDLSISGKLSNIKYNFRLGFKEDPALQAMGGGGNKPCSLSNIF